MECCVTGYISLFTKLLFYIPIIVGFTLAIIKRTYDTILYFKMPFNKNFDRRIEGAISITITIVICVLCTLSVLIAYCHIVNSIGPLDLIAGRY